MDYNTAKNIIIKRWNQGKNPDFSLRKDEFKQILYSILPHLTAIDNKLADAFAYFLFCGAIEYDRYIGSRPKTVNDELHNTFNLFTNSFLKINHFERGSSALLALHKIKWDIFHHCCFKSIDRDIKEYLEACKINIENLSIDDDISNNNKIANEEKNKVLSLIDDLISDKIITIIHASVPYKLTDRDSTIHLVLEGIDIDVHITNRSQGCSLPGVKIKDGCTMETSGPSRWTTTSSELKIVCHCLIDGLEEQPKVTIHQKEHSLFYWNLVFDLTYKVVSSIWGYLQKLEESSSRWLPLPNDIHYLDYEIKAEDRQYDKEFSTNPALLFKIKPLKKEVNHFDFGEIEMPCWSTTSFYYARLYAESGQLDESIFWLNVSTEALIEEFIQNLATNKKVLSEIKKEENKFDSSEQILSEQFPEMKGKVKWPNTITHASIYTKLRRAIKYCKPPLKEKEVIKYYSQISKKRNELFHGDTIYITISDVEKAFNSFQWLHDHLKQNNPDGGE